MEIPFPFLFLPLASLISTMVIEKLCHWLQIYDQPQERKLHRFPVPRLGGFSFFVLPLVACWALSVEIPPYLLAGGFLVFAGGLYDDLNPSNSAWVKLLFQIPAAFAVAYMMPLDWSALSPVAEFAVRFMSFGFVLFMVNAFNLMDNMNGLTAGLAIVIAGCLIAMNGTLSTPLLFLALSIFGFYLRNFPNGRIYMGDQGSQWLGFILSSAALILIPRNFQGDGAVLIGKTAAVLALLFGLFLVDVTRVVWVRKTNGKRLWIGDQNHISHHLANQWGTVRAVLTLTAVQILLAAAATGLLGAWRSGEIVFGL